MSNSLLKFDFWKFVSGFNVLDGERIGKILFVVGICFACLFAFNRLTAKESTQIHSTAPVTVQECKCPAEVLKEIKNAGKNSSFFKFWIIRIG
jgi:hypothetical protein